MLKIFIPWQGGVNDGPLELIDMNQTKQYLVDLGDIFLCKLNICT